jgi:hypothetical protein
MARKKGASGLSYETGKGGSLGGDMAYNFLGVGKSSSPSGSPNRSLVGSSKSSSSVKMPRFSDDEVLPLTRVNTKAKSHRGY